MGTKLNSGLGTHLFVKVPRPGHSEGTFSVFESSCQLWTIQWTLSSHLHRNWPGLKL